MKYIFLFCLLFFTVGFKTPIDFCDDPSTPLPYQNFLKLVSLGDSELETLVQIAKNKNIKDKSNLILSLGFLVNENHSEAIKILESESKNLRSYNRKSAVKSIFRIGGKPLDDYLSHLFSEDDISSHYDALDFTWIIDTYEDMLLIKKNVEQMQHLHPEWKASKAISVTFMPMVEYAIDILKNLGSDSSIRKIKDVIEFKVSRFNSNSGANLKNWANKLLFKSYSSTNKDLYVEYITNLDQNRFIHFYYLQLLRPAVDTIYTSERIRKSRFRSRYQYFRTKKEINSYVEFRKKYPYLGNYDKEWAKPKVEIHLSDYRKDEIQFIAKGRDSLNVYMEQLKSIPNNFKNVTKKDIIKKRQLITALGFLANPDDKEIIHYLESLLSGKRNYSKNASKALVKIGGEGRKKILIDYHTPKLNPHFIYEIFNDFWFHSSIPDLENSIQILKDFLNKNQKGGAYNFLATSFIGRLEKAIQIKEQLKSSETENQLIKILKEQDFHFLNYKGYHSRIWALQQIIRGKEYFQYSESILKTINEISQDEFVSDHLKEYALYTKKKLESPLSSDEKQWLKKTNRNSAMKYISYFSNREELLDYFDFYKTDVLKK